MNSLNNPPFYGGEEWEKHIQILLKRHYGLGNYQEVKAKHMGDYGIEGYSTCGSVFQCYATEAYETNQKYEAQRNKITTDINKFINNKNKLIKIFGNTIINRWILLVPSFDSALLVEHASKKAEDVLKANLPYVSQDFKVIIETDECFLKEIKELAGVGAIEYDTPDIEIKNTDRESWLKSNNVLVNNLELKGNKIPKISADGRIEEFKNLIVSYYLRGQNYLEDVNKYNPDFYARINGCKLTYERELEIMSYISSPSAPDIHFQDAKKEYSQQLQKSFPNLPTSKIDILVWEAISDWLMRCPLDF
ncbi:MAG: hypothetical protein LH649_03805 [Pseudanabaena sp. CAN_BIN31]|nr:hypothetical protein [Pseudanabaena sp. CAN_BIN31]